MNNIHYVHFPSCNCPMVPPFRFPVQLLYAFHVLPTLFPWASTAQLTRSKLFFFPVCLNFNCFGIHFILLLITRETELTLWQKRVFTGSVQRPDKILSGQLERFQQQDLDVTVWGYKSS